MVTDLYDILGVTKSATQAEIRNAYRKRALETHPDRLPPDASEEERTRKNEEFRQVNNAYQVLNDSDARKEYDRTGSHSGSQAEQHGASGSWTSDTSFQQPFPDPFFGQDPFSHPFFNPTSRSRPFHFVDPFELFEQAFPEMRGSHSWHTRHNPYQPSGLSMMMSDMFQDFHDMNQHMARDLRPMSSSFTPTAGGSMTWTSHSVQSSSINGIRHETHQYRDSQGNEHIKVIGPDGRETYTINGVVQNAIPPAHEPRRIRDHHERGVAPLPYGVESSRRSVQRFHQNDTPERFDAGYSHHPFHGVGQERRPPSHHSRESHHKHRSHTVMHPEDFRRNQPPHRTRHWDYPY